VRGVFTDRLANRRVVVIPSALDADGRTRFVAKIAAAVRLQRYLAERCPDVLRVSGEVGEEGDRLLIPHEPATSADPDAIIAWQPRPDIHTLLWLTLPAGRALRAAAQARTVHGGLQFRSIYLDEAGLPKVGDFGIAPAFADVCGPDLRARICCSPGAAPDDDDGAAVDSGTWELLPPGETRPHGWIAPLFAHELFEQQLPLNLQADEFALGVVLFAMATGRHPYGASWSDPLLNLYFQIEPYSLAEVRTDWQEVFERRGGVAASTNRPILAWSALVLGLLASEPEQRQSVVGQAAEACAALAPAEWADLATAIATGRRLLEQGAALDSLDELAPWREHAGLPEPSGERLAGWIGRIDAQRDSLLARQRREQRLNAGRAAAELDDLATARLHAEAIATDADAEEDLRQAADALLELCREQEAAAARERQRAEELRQLIRDVWDRLIGQDLADFVSARSAQADVGSIRWEADSECARGEVDITVRLENAHGDTVGSALPVCFDLGGDAARRAQPIRAALLTVLTDQLSALQRSAWDALPALLPRRVFPDAQITAVPRDLCADAEVHVALDASDNAPAVSLRVNWRPDDLRWEADDPARLRQVAADVVAADVRDRTLDHLRNGLVQREAVRGVDLHAQFNWNASSLHAPLSFKGTLTLELKKAHKPIHVSVRWARFGEVIIDTPPAEIDKAIAVRVAQARPQPAPAPAPASRPEPVARRTHWHALILAVALLGLVLTVAVVIQLKTPGVAPPRVPPPPPPPPPAPRAVDNGDTAPAILVADPPPSAVPEPQPPPPEQSEEPAVAAVLEVVEPLSQPAAEPEPTASPERPAWIQEASICVWVKDAEPVCHAGASSTEFSCDVCADEDIILRASPQDARYSYIWSRDGTDLPDETTHDVWLSPASTDDSGTYSVEISDELRNTVTHSIFLAVHEPPRFAQKPTDIVTCLDDSGLLSLAVHVQDAEQLRIAWQCNGTPLGWHNATEITVSDLKPGTHSLGVAISNEYGCRASADFQVTLMEKPSDLQFDLPGEPLVVGEPVTLKATAKGSEPLTYKWELVDEGAQTAIADSWTPTEPGPVRLSLTVSNECDTAGVSRSEELQVRRFHELDEADACSLLGADAAARDAAALERLLPTDLDKFYAWSLGIPSSKLRGDLPDPARYANLYLSRAESRVSVRDLVYWHMELAKARAHFDTGNKAAQQHDPIRAAFDLVDYMLCRGLGDAPQWPEKAEQLCGRWRLLVARLTDEEPDRAVLDRYEHLGNVYPDDVEAVWGALSKVDFSDTEVGVVKDWQRTDWREHADRNLRYRLRDISKCTAWALLHVVRDRSGEWLARGAVAEPHGRSFSVLELGPASLGDVTRMANKDDHLRGHDLVLVLDAELQTSQVCELCAAWQGVVGREKRVVFMAPVRKDDQLEQCLRFVYRFWRTGYKSYRMLPKRDSGELNTELLEVDLGCENRLIYVMPWLDARAGG